MSARTAIPPQVASLWPPPARVALERSRASDASAYLVIPSASRPRVLVPIDVRGAARMLNRHGGSRLDRFARMAWRRAHRTGIASRLPLLRLWVSHDPNGIEAYLADALGEAVRIGVLLGPPRANLKPVIQAFSESGDTIGFAKVGVTALADQLVETEANALRLLAATSPATFEAPTLLHHGSWREMPVVVQSPLSLAQGDHTPAAPPVQVMVEIAGIAGVTHAPLASSDMLAAVAPGNPSWHGLDLAPLNRLHEALQGVGDIGFGAWHGDFGPWNMGVDGSRVQIWDWERFEVGVPIGFDAAHYQVQRGVAAATDPTVAWRQIVADIDAVHRSMGLDDAATAPAAAYLLAIVARYRRDAVDGPTPALRRRLQWLAQLASVARAQAKELSR